MAGLAEKVKDSLRGRSRHRYSVKAREGESSDESNHTPPMSAVRQSGEVDDDRAPQSSPGAPAWHVHRGTPTPGTTPHDGRSINGDLVSPDRTYKKHRHSHSSMPGLVPTGAQQSDPQTHRHSLPPHNVPLHIPKRKESLPGNRQSFPPLDTTDAEPAMQDQTINRSTDAPNFSRPVTNGGAVTQRVQPEQLTTPSNTSPTETTRRKPVPSQAHGNEHSMTSVTDQMKHLRLPANFDLGHSEKTVVDVQWKPAVTHENIYHHQTEIIQEAITRDIHVHHYYTYVQPIRVVEVLPAKHYRLNETTGEKYEIPTPSGWVMPTDMQPRTVDTSMLKATTRHYLVDEQHPMGITEQAPADFNDHVDLLEPTEYGVWTI